MKITLVAGALVVAALAAPAFAQSAPAAKDFAMKAFVGNTFEVEESKRTLTQASCPKVKAFARKMIKDHTLAEKKLQTAAVSAGPVEMMLDDPHKGMVSALTSKSGADFDKAYVAYQVAAHQDTAALLTDYKAAGDDAKLKAWATKTLPAVNMHLKMVKAMAAM